MSNDNIRRCVAVGIALLALLSGLAALAWAAEPNIQIEGPGGPIPNGGTEDVGVKEPGIEDTFPLTVRNTGTAELDTVIVSVDPDNVDATWGPVGLGISPEGWLTVNWPYTPDASGPFSFDLEITSNDPDESMYVITITGTGGEPQIQIEGPSGPIPNGGSENVGVKEPGIEASFPLTVRNTGTAKLDALIVSANPVNVDSAWGPVGLGISPGTWLTVNWPYTPDASGPFSFDLEIDSNDPDEGDFTITILGNTDTTPPEMTCPGNVEVECPADTSPGATGEPTASDACGSVAISYEDAVTEGCGNTKTIVRTWTATDECGLTTTCDQTITVVDSSGPSIDPEARDLTVECNGAGNINALNGWLASNGGAKASDVCCGTDVTWSNDFMELSDDCGATGSASVTFTATDCCGNRSATTATFTIKDATPPSIAGSPADIARSNDPGLCGAIVPWIPPTGSDLCASVALTSTHIPGNFFLEGTTAVRYTAADACGNQSLCEFRITVSASESPSTTFASTPPDPDRSPTADFEWAGTDNCPAPLEFQTSLDGAGWSAWSLSTSSTIGPLTEGTHTFQVRARDVAGNIESTAGYTWFVDLTPPSVKALTNDTPLNQASQPYESDEFNQEASVS